MNDGIKNDQDRTICEKCQQDPCVCTDKDISPQSSDQKPRVKGSHRTGNPPKLKWL
jgi:hypothetical protein